MFDRREHVSDRAYSVVIPARDAAAFVTEAIASAHAQVPAPVRVIVVDDGSVDETGRIAHGAGAHVVRCGGVGPGAARNAGVTAADTHYVAFLDADDCWAPSHAALCLDAMRVTGAGVAFSATRTFGRVEALLTADVPANEAFDARLRLLGENFVPQTGTFVDRALFGDAGGYDGSFTVSEDFDLWLRLAERTAFVYTGEATALRRVHRTQMSLLQRDAIVHHSWRARIAAVERYAATHTPDEVATWDAVLTRAAGHDIEVAIWNGRMGTLDSLLDIFAGVSLHAPRRSLATGIGLEGDGARWRRLRLRLRCAANGVVRQLLDDRV
ncbi:MAG: glycosyltransferase [Gemmatimonadaceae bacterium]|nr:glycosyltransferase [Gemmatimonadaceae bacterium]